MFQKKAQHQRRQFQRAKEATAAKEAAQAEEKVGGRVGFQEEFNRSSSLQFVLENADETDDEQSINMIEVGGGGFDVEERLKLLESNANHNLENISKLKKENKNLRDANKKLQGLIKEKDNKDKRREMRTQAMISQVSVRNTRAMRTLSEDIYSFLFCSKLRSVPSFIAISTVLLQYAVFIMFFANLLFTQNVPANVEIIVRVAQATAILVTFAAQTDVRVSLRALIYQEGVDEIAAFFAEFTMFRFFLANILMFLQGMLCVVVTIVLIIYTDNVFDLLLNFTAVMFVSELDELVFYMARHGYLGRKAEKLAKDVQETEFQQADMQGMRGNLHVYLFVILLLVGYAFFVYVANLQYNHWSLPTIIKAEFGDTIDPSLSLYSGCYRLVPTDGWEARVDYVSFQTGRGKGRFAYCNNDIRSWTFTPLHFQEGTDVCDSAYLASTEERATSFDLLDAKGDQWKFQTGNPISNFQLIEVVEEEHVERECGDSSFFELQETEVCPILTMASEKEGFSGDRDWSRDFYMLMLDDKPASFYQRPIYIGEYTDPNEGLEVVFFTGRRWLFTSAKYLVMERDNSIKNVTQADLVDPKFVFELLNGNPDDSDDDAGTRLINREVGAYAFITEAIDQGSDTGTPLGLRWYHTRYADNAWDTFPYADISRPTDAVLSCGKCNSFSNPCRFEGVCRDDGTCDCKHGATGKLCEIKPLGDGICHPFFNRGPDKYDGGDCCVATCDGVSCGVGDMSVAFEQELKRSGNGFPYCSDPEMVPLSIVMNHTIDPLFFTGFEDADGGDFETYTIEVRCSDGLPIRVALDPQLTGQVSETLYVGDQTSGCKLSFYGIQSMSLFNAEVQLYDGQATSGALMRDMSNITVDGSFTIPTIYARCMKERLQDLVSSSVYYTGIYQDKALSWLNEEIQGGRCINTKEWLQQRYALVAMYMAEGEPVNAVEQENDHCLWSRINCKDNNPVVITHDGGTTGRLTGFLATEIGVLSHLERFDVFDNELIGTIPTEIGLLTKLTMLAIAETPTITGTIPTTFGQLTSLEEMLVWKNGLTGPIPSEIGLLGEKLGQINVQENLLSGTIPSELGFLTKLTRLTLHSNNLSGSLPSEINEMTSLTNLVLSRNSNLSGTVPDLGKLSNIDTLILSFGKLSGSLPTRGLEKMTTLWTLNLVWNQFTGSIPKEWEQLTSLYWMLINANQLTGTIPDFIGTAYPNLSRFVADANMLVGTIPDTFANLSNLARLRLQSNQFTGEIKPEVMGGWTSMGQLYLSQNQFVGTLPNTIGNLAATMDVFECYDNMFEGTIPEELYQATNLYQLYMMNNKFTGTISEAIGALTNMWYLDLSGNQLNGTIPSTIGLMPSLSYFNVLGGNALTGTVPAEVCNVLIANNADSDVMDNCVTGTPL